MAVSIDALKSNGAAVRLIRETERQRIALPVRLALLPTCTVTDSRRGGIGTFA